MTARCGLIVAPRARADLRAIAAHLEREGPARVDAFLGALETRFESLRAFPRRFPARDDLAAGLRMSVHRPFLIFFTVGEAEDVVRIERVVHGARDLRHLFT